MLGIGWILWKSRNCKPEGAATSSVHMSLGGLVADHLYPVQQCQLTLVLEKYWDIFSQDNDDISQIPVFKHTIEMHWPPVWLPYHWQNPTVQWEKAEHIQQMLDSGIIRPSSSPWASPMVMVQKKDGKLHFCVDFWQLDSAAVKNTHHLHCINDLLDTLHSACWFYTLDLKSGYFQVPIREVDKCRTAFQTSNGQLYEFNHLSFGLCNAPVTFS